ncbi:Thiamin biosynthesis lipoprotein ApbE [plant metagenome]|uniref:FAD:protein FMN transferase n=1 Tax=plant metagenome TaxID=1297885 RepID=A0A484UUY1_9ZZZZ
MKPISTLLLAIFVTLCTLLGAAARAAELHRDDVLGTSLDLRIDAPADQAMAAERAVLAEIARLDVVLSRWREDSELSRFNASVEPQDLSCDLRTVLGLCEEWRARTEGLFSCRMGALAQRWQQAQESGLLPTREELRVLASAAAAAEVSLDDSRPVARPQAVLFDVDALAKGYIIDRALAAARAAAPAATAISLDIGGDAHYWQSSGAGEAWQVGVADARAPRDNQPALATVALRSQAIASSGHATRGYTVGRRHYSHILDPWSGWPMQFAPSATVVAADATSADALATALSVMPIRSGLELADAMPEVAALILSDTGTAFSSQRWPALLAAEAGQTVVPEQLVMDYEVPRLVSDRYHAPYLALWIAHQDGSPVRQLLVLGERSRYLQDLPQWWRRYGRDDLPAIQGIARPTRMPGWYSVAWDGRDDRGQALPPGPYRVQVEAARQGGGHEFLSVPIDTGQGRGLPTQAQGSSEIGALQISRP